MTSIKQLLNCMRELGCESVYLKELAENDNSKNQVYFGPDFNVLNIFPNLDVHAATSGSKATPIFKAPLSFSWLGENGQACDAPHAQMIFYPQYPEVRFSGFLKGCKNSPSELMRQRLAGRKLFIGVTPAGQCYGYVVGHEDPISQEVDGIESLSKEGVFKSLNALMYDADSKELLLKRLREISAKGWITSKRLSSSGELLPCNATNCGGYTLEAELGIIPNGIAEPDYLGWEVKQHKVSNFKNLGAGVITLMTPEPTAGFYVEQGVIPFVRKYGYPDKCGRSDRMNFGGVHRAGKRHPTTKLALELLGFDPISHKITDATAGVALVTEHGEVAAMWGYAGLMKHWNRKHAKAVYVPSLVRKEPSLEYEYGSHVRLGVGTNFLMLLEAFEQQAVYYDPGIKVENISIKPKAKRRSQFRISSKNLSNLYSTFSDVNLFE